MRRPVQIHDGRDLPCRERVDVCICSYRRLSIIDTLQSLARQNLPDGVELRVIVADNNRTSLSRAAIEAAAKELELELCYLHVSESNISLARNRCLDEVRSEWFAFIDDDEVASANWLRSLLAARRGKDVVFGPVRALYPDPRTPNWMVAGDFHSTGQGANDPPDKGYSGNVLIRRRTVEDARIRFDPALGRIGGEDTSFFQQLHRQGARFGHEPRALAYEPADETRANLRWLLKRRFRMGQVHWLLTSRAGNGSGRLLLSAAAKAAVSFSAAAALMPFPQRAAAQLLRSAFHLGVAAGGSGVAPIAGYGGATSARLT